MSVLASLLVRDQVVSVDQVQEAIQQQVMRGGNLDTVLLELGWLGENAISAYCAAVYGLVPATRNEVMHAPVDVVRGVPREFAVRHRLIPLTRTEDAIVLAVDRPLSDAISREISFELGVDPTQRVACSVRIEAGLAKHYDIEMTSRMRKLAQALDALDEGAVPYVAPFQGVGKRSSLPPRKKISGSYPRVESSIPAPVGIADTEPPPPGSRPAGRVPAGTFRDSDPGSATGHRTRITSGFIDATRYSLPPRPPEVLGRPTQRGSGREGAQPRGRSHPPAHHNSPQAAWHSAPMPVSDEARTQPRGRSLPHDPRRDNDGSALFHDIVSIPPGTPSSVPPGVEPSSRVWGPAPPPTGSDSLPSVIVDFGDEVERLIEVLRDAGPEDEMVILPLLAVGESALPALVREFPGRLWFDRNEPYARIPAGRDVSPVARTLVAFGQRSVPYLIPLLEHPDPEIRYYATLVASEFVHPELVEPTGKRLFDEDAGVRAAAYRALSLLYACEDEFGMLIDQLRAGARDGRKPSAQVTSIEALGRLRDVHSFEFLVSLLDSPSVDVIRAAHASLVRLSCQDFGTSKKKWRAWYDKHDTAHRVEWLIEALMHGDERLRRRASEELKHLTQEYFGYEPGHAKREREAAQQKYRRWWEEVGSRMFHHSERPDSGQVGSQ